MAGRLVCDIKISAKELIRARSYDLETLCKQVTLIYFNVFFDFPQLIQSYSIDFIYIHSKGFEFDGESSGSEFGRGQENVFDVSQFGDNDCVDDARRGKHLAPHVRTERHAAGSPDHQHCRSCL